MKRFAKWMIYFLCVCLFAVLFAACGEEGVQEGSAPFIEDVSGESSAVISSVETSFTSEESNSSDESLPEESSLSEGSSEPEESSKPEESSEPEEPLPEDLSTLEYTDMKGVCNDSFSSGRTTVKTAVVGNKTVLAFGSGKNCYYVVLPQTADHYSIAAWYGRYAVYAITADGSKPVTWYECSMSYETPLNQAVLTFLDGYKNPRLFCSHTDGSDNYLAVFDRETGAMRLFKMDDSGRELKNEVDIQTPPAVEGKEPAAMYFFGKQTGVMAFRSPEETGLSQLLFYTADGGKNWLPAEIDAPEGTIPGDYEVVDLIRSNGENPVYTLTVKNGEKASRFVSADLLSWREMPEIFEGVELKGGVGDAGMLYAVIGEEMVIHLPDWGKTMRFPKDNAFGYGMAGDVAFVATKSRGNLESCTVYKLVKGQEEPVVTELAIHPGNDFVSAGIDFQTVNDKVAFLIVTGLDEYWENEGFLAIYRTTDGGETWEAMQGEDPPYWDGHEDLVMWKFFDENIGIRTHDCHINNELEYRTMATFDGGKSWQSLSELPYGPDVSFDAGCSYVIDWGYTNGVYWMVAGFNGDSMKGVEDEIFISTDLLDWERVEELPLPEPPADGGKT